MGMTRQEVIDRARRLGGDGAVRSVEASFELQDRVGHAFDEIVKKEIESARDPQALLSGLCEAATSVNARVAGMMGTSLDRPVDEVVAIAKGAVEAQIRATYKIIDAVKEGLPEGAEIKVPDGMAEMIAAAAARGGSDA